MIYLINNSRECRTALYSYVCNCSYVCSFVCAAWAVDCGSSAGARKTARHLDGSA